MSGVAQAYAEVGRAIAYLERVRGSIFGNDHELRDANAVAIRAAREAAGRASALLKTESVRDPRWSEVAEKIARLPRVVIVEPFGRFEMRGARTIESAGAKTDRKALASAAALIRDIARTSGSAELIEQLAGIDRDPKSESP